MSVSQHPIALRLEQRVGGATKLLATVMALPLVDGIFPALVVANALTVPFGILQTGLLIFGGSATMAVILAEMDGSRREQATSVLLLGAILVPVAMVEAALAETLQTMLAFEVFHRFAGLVILAVAAKTASAKVGEYLPSPAVIIGLGLLASFQPSDAHLVVSLDPTTLLKAAATVSVGIGFALGVVIGAPKLRGAVDLDLFRFGSAVALGMLALEILGLLPTTQPVALGVLAVTAIFSYDPSAGRDTDVDVSNPAASPDPVTDGGDGAPEADPDEEPIPDPEAEEAEIESQDDEAEAESDEPREEHPPWL